LLSRSGVLAEDAELRETLFRVSVVKFFHGEDTKYTKNS
jgi:hypothetical protein